MTAVPFFIGGLLFLLLFSAHLAIWRLWKVKKEIFFLVAHFLFVPFFLFLCGDRLGLWPRHELCAGALLYFSLAVVYLQTYPALKADIPSFRILLLIQASGSQGLQVRDICEALGRGGSFHVRKMEELQNDVFVSRRNGNWELTLAGKILTDFFIAYRRFLGFEIGKG
ncbi:MAG: hypothetical protein HYZ87_02460 [Candidatus Omnitrophica bacterium]|nr:hypothetical protein [Candidatus Omnitrophota bacterium]